ncbi:hypothetical protein GYMLUDRAFT_245160 [Collybiopsis luxurians FD-317 M1]|uniref:Uncharacterized protein n=1 Tax=Collybiopsis luxurians FD-317 M1 TaxID=944289 RepID=A0A0D0CAK7_9AGAR|nr:hypothetical protein GYMLUDRAFT_245160 [Collybiopsis luxurians FD-317 M1]
MPPSSQSELPEHDPGRLVGENIGQATVLVVFLHVWLTMIHLFAVVTTNFASKVGLSTTLPSCCVIAFATLFIVTVGFALYLEALLIPRIRWGYFDILFRIITSVFYLVYAILWIIDLFQGRIELFRRREGEE